MCITVSYGSNQIAVGLVIRLHEVGVLLHPIPLDCLSDVMPFKKRVVLLAILHILRLLSVERKNPLKRDQALNDATSGQIGEEPRPEPSSSKPTDINEQRIKAARKMSRDL